MFESRSIWPAMLLGAASCLTPARVPQPQQQSAPGPAEVKPEPVSSGVMIGRFCPDAAAGRPGIEPLAVFDGAWKTAVEPMARAISTRATRQFEVIHWSGQRAGVFSVAGRTSVAGRPIAVGSYAGALPCRDSDDQPIAECIRVNLQCGLAVAVLEAPGGFGARPFEEDPELGERALRRSCINEATGAVSIDLDGDNKRETFEIASNVGAELLASKRAPKSCEEKFAGEIDVAGTSSLVGAIDIDGDGRHELVIGRNRKGAVRWQVYRSQQTAARLERVIDVAVGGGR